MPTSFLKAAHMHIRHWITALFLTMVVAPVAAEGYPAKPVRFIVPYAPGGSSDILARLFGQRLTETMGQTFVVDNRPGAGGMVEIGKAHV